MKMFTTLFLVISLIATSLPFSASDTSEDVKCSNIPAIPLDIIFGCHLRNSNLTSSDENRSKCYLTWPERVELPSWFLLRLLANQGPTATSSILCNSSDICTLQFNNPNDNDPSSSVSWLCNSLGGNLTGMSGARAIEITTTIADSPKSEKFDDPGTANSSRPPRQSLTIPEQQSVTDEEPNSAVMFWVGFIVVFVFVFVMVIWIVESVNPSGYNSLRSRYRCSSEIPLIHVDRPESYGMD